MSETINKLEYSSPSQLSETEGVAEYMLFEANIMEENPAIWYYTLCSIIR